MNVCVFSGRTTKDIELKTSKGGNSYCRFSIAVDSGFGDNRKTSFLNMTAFGKTAESLEKWVKKGNKIEVRCEASQNQYTDKDGNKRSDIVFTLQTWEFAGSKKDDEANNNNSSVNNDSGNQQNNSSSGSNDFMDMPDDLDEQLPFS